MADAGDVDEEVVRGDEGEDAFGEDFAFEGVGGCWDFFVCCWRWVFVVGVVEGIFERRRNALFLLLFLLFLLLVVVVTAVTLSLSALEDNFS